MGLLIDGHNLIGFLPDISLTDPNDELQLVMRLRVYAAHHKQPVIVAFDNGAPPGLTPDLSGGGVRALFARPGDTADALILRRLQTDKRPQKWRVVTGDRDLATRARALGAQIVSPAEFAARLTKPPRRVPPRQAAADDEAAEKPRTVGDVDEWLALFGRKRRRRR